MRYLKLSPALFCSAGLTAVFFSLLVACSGNSSSWQAKTQPTPPAGAIDQLIDTSKLKADVNDLMQSISDGKPDTNKLKKAGADILSTAARVLSDSGISKMGDNSNDPAQTAAKNAMIKIRNATGLTPGTLDSLKKAASQLDKN